MGADRRGPLAAFIVVAVIAAVLLVTSVRSHAAPGGPRPAIASVAGLPSAADLVRSHTSHQIHRAVRQGVTLSERPGPATAGQPSQPGRAEAPTDSGASAVGGATSAPLTAGHGDGSSSAPARPDRRVTGIDRPRLVDPVGGSSGSAPDVGADPAPGQHGHGQHEHGQHGQGQHGQGESQAGQHDAHRGLPGPAGP